VRNEHQSLIDLIREKGADLIGLTLGGGEPLLQKGLAEMLRLLDPIKVHVNVLTNLSIDITKNEIYQLLKTWPNVSWQLSFDNANKEKFEYVRHGASWEQFVTNIHTMRQDNQNIIAHPAYSIYCAFDLEEYYEFCNQNQLSVFWCDLWNPAELDTRRLPRSFILNAVDVIDNVTDKWSRNPGQGLDTLLRYRLQMLDPDYQRTLTDQKIDIIGFHNRIEQELNKTTRFIDLWPRYKDIK
jgi:hypothetical protein